jgi:hypothetical protein
MKIANCIEVVMKIEDIDLLERITSKYKYRYDILDNCFNTSVANTVVYVPINITILLAELKQFGETLDDNKEFPMHCAIAVLNLFAHYRHYYMTRNASLVVLVGYVKDSFNYRRFHSIISIIEDLCEFFPHIYFMGDVASIKHTILVGSLLKYIYSISLNKTDSVIHIYSSLNVDKQLMFIFPAKDSYKICKPMNSSKVDFLSKNQFLNKIFKENEDAFNNVSVYKSEIERLSVILGIYFGSYECCSSSEKNTFTFSFIKETIKNKAKHLLFFIEKVYDKNNKELNINHQFTLFLKNYLNNQVELESLKSYIRRYDYFSHQGSYMHNFIQPVYKAYNTKLKDYNIAKEAEKYRLLITHQLYANWLMF